MSRDELADVMHGEDRVLIAAWMLPPEGVLSEEQRREAMDNFSRYVRMHRLDVAEVARQVGTPGVSLIRQLMSGTYRGQADESIRRLNLWVEQDARRRAGTKAEPLVNTKVAKDLFAVARIVRENQTIGMAVGPSGIGKSHCARAIAEKYIGAIHLRIIRGWHTANGLLSAIAGEVGVRTSSVAWGQRYRTQLERVIESLADSGRLFIIDEAHKLHTEAIELLRDIHDTTACPMLFLATKDLHDRIARDADPDHGQVYSRIGVVVHLAQGCDVESGGRPLFSITDIRALYNEPPLRLATDAERYLTDLANRLGEGSLRRCKALVVNAARRARHRQGLAETDAVTVTADDLAWCEVHLRQGEGQDQRERVVQRLNRAAVG